MRIAIGWKRRTLAIGAGLALFSGPGAFAAAPPPGAALAQWFDADNAVVHLKEFPDGE